MNRPAAMMLCAAVPLAAAAGIGGWWLQHSGPAAEAPPPATEALPIPPVPPRIAQGDRYEQCLAMLVNDPAGAASTAGAWARDGGGDGAAHCLALSRIALGAPADGAQMLENLAAGSQAPAAARASIYGQATQAWLIAGDLNHALPAATLALSLLPDDPDLLIDHAAAAGSLDRYQDAIADLSRALALDPRRVDALVARAGAWRHLGRLDQAQDDIDRALALNADDPEALLERGILRQRRNDPKGARSDWERAMRMAPDSATADLAEQNLALLEAGPAKQ